MPNQRKKILGICETSGCQMLAKYGINRCSLKNIDYIALDTMYWRDLWVKLCGVCVRIIELENKEVQERVEAGTVCLELLVISYE